MTEFNEQGYGVDESRDIAIYHRWGTAEDGQLERFIIVLNFSDYDQQVMYRFQRMACGRICSMGVNIL